MSNGTGKKSNRLRGNYLLPIVAAVLALAAIVAALWLLFSQTSIFKGFGANKNSSSTAVAAASSSVPSQAAQSSVPASSAGPSVSTSSYSTTTLSNPDFFSNAIFVGDASTKGITDYKITDNGAVLADVSMSAYRSLRIKVKTDSGSATLVDALKAKNPGRIYLQIGSNDVLLFDSSEQFTGYYGALLDEIKKQLPNAAVYAESIFPVTASYEAKKPKLTNSRIDDFNSALKTLASQKGAKYLDVASILKGPDGKLPTAKSTDGINIRKPYYYAWLNYLSANS